MWSTASYQHFDRHYPPTNQLVSDPYPLCSFLSFRDGRLREGDQLLAIDGQPLDISHQQAIHILQSAQGPVEIVVARGPVPKAPGSGSAQSPASPASSGGTFESQLPASEQVTDPVIETPVEDGGLGQGDKSDMVVSTSRIVMPGSAHWDRYIKRKK